MLLVSGSSRNELAKRGNDVIREVVEWSSKAKLEFSGEMSNIMMLKGKFARWREPVLRIKEQE